MKRGELKKSKDLVTQLVGDIEMEKFRFEGEKRILAEQMVRETAQKDAEYEKVVIKLAETEKNS